MTRFFCISDPSLLATNNALQAACASRNIEYIQIDWQNFDETISGRPVKGDLIYRPATAYGASQLEQWLWCDGIGAFYATPETLSGDQRIAFTRAGIPIPQTEYGISTNRYALRRNVERLGGFPVVLKCPGREGGAGTIFISRWETLFSVIDYTGTGAVMQRFIDHVIAYRLVLVGKEVVAVDGSYPAIGDFRTNAYGGVIGAVTPPPGAVELVQRAAKALHLEFGGADILETANGELFLAEFNSPCYFPGTQEATGVDIAGAMVDWLLKKAAKSKRPAKSAGRASKKPKKR